MSVILFRYMSMFGEGGMLLSLLPLSAAAGLAMLLLFRRFSNQAALRETKRRLSARLLEFRLYRNEPGTLWRACGAFAALNLRYLALATRPVAIAALPLAYLLLQLESVYGWHPLSLGKPAVVTLQMKPDAADPESAPGLEPPPGVVVESPPVRVYGEKQISWRIRPARGLRRNMRLTLGREVFLKEIQAGGMTAPIDPRRSGSLLGALRIPGEPRFESNSVAWIGIDYPRRAIGPGRFRFHWLVWFCVMSLLAAWLFKKRLGVVV